jgi:hypothetical protein
MDEMRGEKERDEGTAWGSFATGDASGYLHGAGEAAKTGIDRASGYIQGAAEATKAGVDRATGYIEGVAGQTQEYVQAAVKQTSGKLARYREQGVDKVWSDVVQYTRERPGTALLIAAGAGVVVGMLGVMSRRQPPSV